MSFFRPKESIPDENYTKEKINHTTIEDMEEVVSNETSILEKISESGLLKKYIAIADTMFMLVKDYRKGIYTIIPWLSVASIVMTLLYVLSPLDGIPDLIPGLGYIDDLTVISLVTRWIEKDLHDYLDWKLKNNDQLAEE